MAADQNASLLIPADVYQSINQSLEFKCLFDDQQHSSEVNLNHIMMSAELFSMMIECLLCSCRMSNLCQPQLAAVLRFCFAHFLMTKRV